MGSIRALAPPQLLSTASLKAAGRPKIPCPGNVQEIAERSGQDDLQAETRMLRKGWETIDKMELLGFMKLHGLASRLCPGPLLVHTAWCSEY